MMGVGRIAPFVVSSVKSVTAYMHESFSMSFYQIYRSNITLQISCIKILIPKLIHIQGKQTPSHSTRMELRGRGFKRIQRNSPIHRTILYFGIPFLCCRM
ncbi:hypothetical protein ACB092_03G034800 [Castanea dentata]